MDSAAVQNGGNGVYADGRGDSESVVVILGTGEFSNNGRSGIRALGGGVDASKAVINVAGNREHGLFADDANRNGSIEINYSVWEQNVPFPGPTSVISANALSGVHAFSLTAAHLSVHDNGDYGIMVRWVELFDDAQVFRNGSDGVHAHGDGGGAGMPASVTVRGAGVFNDNGGCGINSRGGVDASGAVIEVTGNREHGVNSIADVTINFSLSHSVLGFPLLDATFPNRVSRISGNGKTGILTHSGDSPGSVRGAHLEVARNGMGQPSSSWVPVISAATMAPASTPEAAPWMLPPRCYWFPATESTASSPTEA